MQQKWWLIAAGVIGIGLAVLLFPRPDTGGDTPAPDPRNTDPLDFKSENKRPTLKRPAVTGEGKLEPRAIRRAIENPEERLGPNPIAADLAKRRSTPEAIHAGRASGPWTVIRRQLLLMTDDAEAAALSAELEPLVVGLRDLRRDPEGGDYAALEQQQKDLAAKVRANEAWMADRIVAASIERIDGIMAEYHEAAAMGEPGDDEQE